MANSLEGYTYLYFCRPCTRWWLAVDGLLCPSCGEQTTQADPTPHNQHAAVMATADKHGPEWHQARIKLGGSNVCDCGWQHRDYGRLTRGAHAG